MAWLWETYLGIKLGLYLVYKEGKRKKGLSKNFVNCINGLNERDVKYKRGQSLFPKSSFGEKFSSSDFAFERYFRKLCGNLHRDAYFVSREIAFLKIIRDRWPPQDFMNKVYPAHGLPDLLTLTIVLPNSILLIIEDMEGLAIDKRIKNTKKEKKKRILRIRTIRNNT
ncbi:MAG: hypothetical protein M3015_10265 [Bacteroidota bacterium]|nr:hypothetical protein [Bacteroidota bacterium]